MPWHNLPAYHAELQRAGYVTDELTFENYFQLWRCASTNPGIDLLNDTIDEADATNL